MVEQQLQNTAWTGQLHTLTKYKLAIAVYLVLFTGNTLSRWYRPSRHHGPRRRPITPKQTRQRLSYWIQYTSDKNM